MKIKVFLLHAIILTSSILLTSCWNYREIDQLAVVVGAAIDKGVNSKYCLTVEIVEVTPEKDTSTKSKTLTFEGKTIFDAARNAISVVGKRLYWSHTKEVIISREIAEEGLINVLDWYNRDAETRGDIHIMVAKTGCARDILTAKGATEQVKSFEIDKMMSNQRSLSKAPQVEIWEITNELTRQGVGAIASAIGLQKVNNDMVPQSMGIAVFRQNKLIGFLNDEETKALLFLRNEIKGGVLIEDVQNDGSITKVSLEIFNSKTKIKPVASNGNISMKVSIETTVAIDEIGGTANIIEDEGRKKLEEAAEMNLKNQIQSTIKKVQMEFGVDTFGFGIKLREENPNEWKAVAENWAEKFKELQIDLQVKVHIKNSAMLSKPLEVGD